MPRAGRHAAAARAVRIRSGGGAAADGARADGPVRPRRGDRQRGAVPGLGRVVVRQRHRVPGGRRDQRGVHDAVVSC